MNTVNQANLDFDTLSQLRKTHPAWRLLRAKAQTTLPEVIAQYPMQQGLAELVTYLAIAGADDKAVFHDEIQEKIV